MGGAADTSGSDDLSRWIGREQRMTQTLNPFPARALAALLDHAHLPEDGDALPAAWHWLYFLETPSSAGTGPDGHAEKGSFMPPTPLPRRMWASGALDLAAPLRLGESAEKVSTIRAAEHKQGKSGELFFVTIDHDVHQRGILCVHEEQTLVYRSMPTGRAPLPPGASAPGASAPGASAPAAADWSRTVNIDPVLLFRFSALTYNAHRIHYDREYATSVEGYPGLVVHGPLLVMLLLDLVRAHKPAAAIKAVRFRAMRPTFDLGAFSLHGRCEDPRVALWSADGDDYVGMSATATLDEEP
jgi:3-methylfumaryl-CoA hydratase